MLNMSDYDVCSILMGHRSVNFELQMRCIDVERLLKARLCPQLIHNLHCLSRNTIYDTDR
jgi:hypothetical protein